MSTAVAGRGVPTLVVGARGLLGSAVGRHLRARGATVLEARVPWADRDRAVPALHAALAALLRAADGGPWQLAWCAGSGVTSTPRAVLEAEVASTRRWVDEVLGEGADLAGGRVFLASSAGGVYAGAGRAPFSELTEPAPLSAYGEAKLAMEAEIRRLARDGGARALVGRLSNLYGPGQDLTKAQGLISQLCRSQITGQPLGVYVSLDTVRDYLFVADAAGMVADGLAGLPGVVPAGDACTKILASQRSASIAAVVGEVRRVFRRRPPLRLAASPHAAGQARDLRFRSVVWPELDRRQLTTLPAGILATAHDLARHIRAGELVRS
jgi:UDP-glucose 4-epimerase